MSDTIRAGKIIASAILVVGGVIAIQHYSGEEGDQAGLVGVIPIIGIILLLENWLLLFSSVWKALVASYQSSHSESSASKK